MRNIYLFILFISFSKIIIASQPTEDKSSNSNSAIDTNFIDSHRSLLNTKFLLSQRYNKFSIKDDITGQALEYSVNSNENMGFGANYKGIGFEFQFAPRFLNNNKNDSIYGKSSQFSISFGGNGRRFIYDVYYRENQGFHTTQGFKIPNDTSNRVVYFYRPDIKNVIFGSECVYVLNNTRFSSSAPYNYTQRQKKGAGSALVGAFFSIYSISADSVIFPDSLKDKFKPEVQIKKAGSSSFGISYGYTYTFVFGKHKYWYANIYTLPGLSLQQYYSTNGEDISTKSKLGLALAFQYRLALGYNRTRYFYGFSAMGNNRFHFGYRFGLKREYIKLIK
jgi:hypothetical protein